MHVIAVYEGGFRVAVVAVDDSLAVAEDNQAFAILSCTSHLHIAVMVCARKNEFIPSQNTVSLRTSGHGN